MPASPSSLLSDRTLAACRRRLDRLEAEVASQPFDALLVTSEKDIRYLTGFIGHDSMLLVQPDRAVVISDPRYDEHLQPWRDAGHVEVVIGVRHRLEESVRSLCDASVRTLGFQSESVTVATRDSLVEALSGLELVASCGLVATLRMIKDDLEIARIEQAVTIQQDALQETLGQLRPGMTEAQFAALLEYEMRMRGAARCGFDAIVGAGANSSIPHHETGTTPIERGVLLVDWGAQLPDGYNADLTRTFSIGPMPDRLREIYAIVLEAQLAAIEACLPGRRCGDVDAVARRIITDAGYGDRFGHGLGHGIGLDVHESPYFSPVLGDVELQSGMIMTVEPGIYLPGVGGVRIEDDVLITDQGPRVLSNWPKTLDSAIIEPVSAGQPVG